MDDYNSFRFAIGEIETAKSYYEKLTKQYPTTSRGQKAVQIIADLIEQQKSIFFQDDFSTAEKWSTVGGEWKIDNASYVVNNASQEETVALAGQERWKDLVYTGRFKFLVPLDTEYDVRILVRVLSNQLYGKRYTITHHTSGFVSLYEDGGGRGQLLSKPVRQNFQMNKWYTFKVELIGNTMNYWIDNKLLFSYTDIRYPNGKIGIGVWNRSRVQFAEIKVMRVQ